MYLACIQYANPGKISLTYLNNKSGCIIQIFPRIRNQYIKKKRKTGMYVCM